MPRLRARKAAQRAMIVGELCIGHGIGHADLGSFPATRCELAALLDLAGFGRLSRDRGEPSGKMCRIRQAGHQASV
jgi:hypothetical protein